MEAPHPSCLPPSGEKKVVKKAVAKKPKAEGEKKKAAAKKPKSDKPKGECCPTALALMHAAVHACAAFP